VTVVDSYFPFDSGTGSIATPAHWRSMSRNWQPPGVIPGIANQCNPTIAGSVVTVGTGAMWIDGFYGEITVAKTVSVSGNGMVVGRADPNDRTVKIYFVANQTVPTQPANSTGIYEIPIAQVTGTTLTDIRQYSYGLVVPCGQAGANNQTIQTADGTWFQIGYLGTYWVKGGMTFGGSTLTVPTDGIYQVGAMVTYEASNNVVPAGRYVCAIRQNNITIAQGETHPSVSSTPQPKCSVLANCKAKDTINMWGWKQNGGSSVASYALSFMTFLSVAFVSR
jgi:hypothetical protein